jgi:hypothetical protein
MRKQHRKYRKYRKYTRGPRTRSTHNDVTARLLRGQTVSDIDWVLEGFLVSRLDLVDSPAMRGAFTGLIGDPLHGRVDMIEIQRCHAEGGEYDGDHSCNIAVRDSIRSSVQVNNLIPSSDQKEPASANMKLELVHRALFLRPSVLTEYDVEILG